MAVKTHKARARHDRKKKSFEHRYKMSMAEFRTLKKSSPKEANDLRMRASQLVV